MKMSEMKELKMRQCLALKEGREYVARRYCNIEEK